MLLIARIAGESELDLQDLTASINLIRMSYQKQIFKYYLKHTDRYRLPFVLYMLCTTGAVLCSDIIIPLLFKQFIDLCAIAESVNRAEALNSLYVVLFWVLAIALLNVLFRFACDWNITQVNPYVMRDIENDCFKRLHSLSYSFFADSPIGAIVSKVRRFADAYEGVSFNLTRGVYEILIQYLFSLIVVAYFSIEMAVIFVAWGVVFVITNQILVGWKMRFDQTKAAAESVNMGALADSLTNFLNIKIFARLNHESTYFSRTSTEAADRLYRSWIVSTKINVIQGILIVAFQVIVLFVSLRMWSSDAITIGTVVLLQAYLIKISGTLREFGNYLKATFRAFANGQEMIGILDIKPDIADPRQPEPCQIDRGTIEFKDVDFGYGNGSLVFNDFSVRIAANEKVGLVGPSGSGKSSLTKLLMRFVDVNQGAVLIDGQNIRNITQDDLRTKISYVPQEPILFHRSIGENIAYGKIDANEEAIHQAAKNAYIYDFIIGLSNGFDTLVGERGVKLSGGERQRIAIARAMLRDTPILILDEATSSLDSISERYIQLAFERLIQNRTTIVIAHRLSTIRMLDRILVMKEGRVVESGPHDQLLSSDGIYKALWEQQVESFSSWANFR